MFWGNTNAGDSSSTGPTPVGNPFSNGFLAVWHLASTNPLVDATGNGKTLTANNGAAQTGVVGPINAGYDLTTPAGACADADKGIEKSLSFSNITLPANGPLTMNAWVNPAGTGCGYLFNIAVSSGGARIQLNQNATSNLGLGVNNLNGTDITTPGTAFPNGSWQHVGFTISGTTGTIYVNGTNQQSGTVGAITATTYVYGLINAHYYGETAGRGYFSAKYDEVELSNVARDAAWMSLCYQSQIVNPTWITIALTGPPSITTQPSSATKDVGQSVTFTVGASGGPTPSHQWYKTGHANPIAGATNPSFTISSVQLSDAATYTDSVYNTWGYQVSSGAVLTVYNLPTVATAASATPSPVTGTTTTLSTLGASGAGEGTLTYIWATTGTPPAAVTYSANGTNAAKTTTATFTKAGSYNFQVTITDLQGGSVTSPVAVTVNQTQTSASVSPATASVQTNNTQQFTASANDQFGAAMSSQPTFTWTVSGGGTINGSGLFTAGSSAGGPYTVTATSGSLTPTATLNIFLPCVAPSISVQPQTDTVPSGMNATFSVTATGTGLTYQWQDSIPGGGPWSNVAFGTGGTTPIYTFTTAMVDSIVFCRCQVTGTCGNATSSVAVCNVCNPPSVTVNTQNQSVQAGQTATFTMSAAGPNISLQWQRSDDGGYTFYNLTGQTNSTYSFTTAQSDSGAQFMCEVFNTCDIIYSNAAILAVCTPTAMTRNWRPCRPRFPRNRGGRGRSPSRPRSWSRSGRSADPPRSPRAPFCPAASGR